MGKISLILTANVQYYECPMRHRQEFQKAFTIRTRILVMFHIITENKNVKQKGRRMLMEWSQKKRSSPIFLVIPGAVLKISQCSNSTVTPEDRPKSSQVPNLRLSQGPDNKNYIIAFMVFVKSLYPE